MTLTLASLSPRRRQVAELIAQRLSRDEIAESLHCSVHTVDAHITYLSTKLRDKGYKPERPELKGMRLIRLWIREQAA